MLVAMTLFLSISTQSLVMAIPRKYFRIAAGKTCFRQR